MSDPTELLMQMNERSARKLRSPKNLAKESWYEMTDSDVMFRLCQEISELEQAIKEGLSWDAIADEAADIYHFASMGADPRRVPRRSRDAP